MGAIKEIQLLWIYNSQLQPGMVVKNHSHAYFHLINITEGRMEIAFQEQIYTLEKGDIVWVPKGMLHRFYNDSNEAVHYYQLNFSVLNQSLVQMLEMADVRVVRDAFGCELISRIWQEYVENRALKDEFSESALKMLLLHLTAQSRSLRGEEQEVIDTAGCSVLAKQVIGFLTENYARDLSLDDVAAGVGVTKHYLCNAFKQSTGTTINGCLNMIRIRKAAELIVYSDLPLPQVAQMCGYVSVSHFNRVFMRYVGIPPGQCRRAFSFDNLSNARRSAGSFMYSVLAGKSITSDMINEYEQSRKDEKE